MGKTAATASLLLCLLACCCTLLDATERSLRAEAVGQSSGVHASMAAVGIRS